MSNEQVDEALRKSLADNDCEAAERIVEENIDEYDGDLEEAAFRIAVQNACYAYVYDHYDDVELNDIDGCWSSYLNETEDESIIDLLTSVGANRDTDEFSDCRFAVETANNEVVAFDKAFHKEVWDKVVSVLGLSEKQIAQMLINGEAKEYKLPDIFASADVSSLEKLCELLLVSSGGEQLVLSEYCREKCGWQLIDLIEAIGWKCDFEGESWKFETTGVYYIN